MCVCVCVLLEEVSGLVVSELPQPLYRICFQGEREGGRGRAEG